MSEEIESWTFDDEGRLVTMEENNEGVIIDNIKFFNNYLLELDIKNKSNELNEELLRTRKILNDTIQIKRRTIRKETPEEIIRIMRMRQILRNPKQLKEEKLRVEKLLEA